MRFTRISLAAVVVLLVAACSSSGAPGGQQGAAATAAPTAAASAAPSTAPVAMPASMQGTWTSNVTGTTASSGVWTLRISKDNIELKNPNASDAEYFSLNPGSATDAALDLNADPDCQGASYAWRIDAGKLLLVSPDDPCGDRKAVLTAGPWTKAS